MTRSLPIRCSVLLVSAWLVSAAAAAAQQREVQPGVARRVLWTGDTKAPSFGSAAAGDIDGDGKPEIAFGTYFNDEHLYVLNGEDGSVLWKFRSEGGPIDTSVLLFDVDGDKRLEVLFGDSARGTLFCLDGKGRRKWVFRGQSGTDSPPAAADLDGDGDVEVVYGTMKTRSGNGHVNVLDGRTGKLAWTVQIPGHVQSEPALVDLDGDGDRDVLVTNWMGDDQLRALDGRGGKELWRHATGDSVYHGVSVADFDGDGRPEIVVADRKGRVWMLEGESGRPKWEISLAGERRGSVFGPTSLVRIRKKGPPAIVVCGAHVHVVDHRGKVLWTRRYGGRSIARGVAVADVDGDGVRDLLFGQGTHLRALRADSGKELWSLDLRFGKHRHEGIDNAPLILDLDGDGRLDVFVVTGKGLSDKSRPGNYGRAFAIRAGRGKPRPGNTWTTFRGSPRRLGRPAR